MHTGTTVSPSPFHFDFNSISLCFNSFVKTLYFHLAFPKLISTQQRTRSLLSTSRVRYYSRRALCTFIFTTCCSPHPSCTSTLWSLACYNMTSVPTPTWEYCSSISISTEVTKTFENKNFNAIPIYLPKSHIDKYITELQNLFCRKGSFCVQYSSQIMKRFKGFVCLQEKKKLIQL